MTKKIISFVALLFITSCLFAQKIHDSQRDFIPISGLERGTIILPYTDAVFTGAIDYEFVVEPATVMTSYYDYILGGFSGFPIEKQIFNGNGTYLTFCARETPDASRHQYYAYFNESGNLVDYGPISIYDALQGFGDIVLHPATGNCIASWHEVFTGEYTACTLAYDDYNLNGLPGFWSTVTTINPTLPDEYIWPRLYIGTSPEGDDWVRIYHISQNSALDPYGNPCEDVRIMYMDIENTLTADLTQILDTSNWTTVTPMYYWRDKSCRPISLSFAVDKYYSGKVGLIGYCVWNEGDLGNMPTNPGIFVWESFDYGETWDTANLHSHSQTSSTTLYQVENKPQFQFDGVTPDELDVEVFGFNNSAYYYYGNLVMTYLQCYTYTNPQTHETYYLNHFIPQAEAIWDSYYSEFTFHEVPHLPGYDSSSGQSVPWQIIDNDTILYIVVAYPTSDYGDLQKNAISYWGEYEPRIQIWSDATYLTMAQLGYHQYDEYLEHPIINIAFSYPIMLTTEWMPDWISMIELTDINNPLFNFSDQITIFPYVDNFIHYIGYSDDGWSGWNEIYLYYFDDNSFGHYVPGQGTNTGGQIKYCVVKFRVYQWSIDQQYSKLLFPINKPNPFSSSTDIYFSSTKPIKEAKVKIYNTKGQLINNLNVNNGATSTEGYAVWNGKDMNGNDVANGIYLYKIVTPEVSQTGKMLLNR